MNIKQAKEQIKNAVIAYRTRDPHGRLMTPESRQRPLFLVGAPGIGKTAVVEQVARELDIGYVSYSITHHTRQSALGLPFIRERQYGNETFRVSEYTMSEIIASVYEEMEKTGHKEGILFLDEINCVSETLAPAMLQFLQFKVFGQHRVPEGWIVVTAGNPPEYNASVREFDMVTSDRLKRIDIEPDYGVWRQWAADEGVHAAVLSFLDIRNEDFYRIEASVDGRRYVTPRGWADLSDMLKLYELNGLAVDRLLVEQYVRNDETAGLFADYYALWQKYRYEYRIEDILAGTLSEDLTGRAAAAPFDERLTIVGLIMDGVEGRLKQVMQMREGLTTAKTILEQIKDGRRDEKKDESVWNLFDREAGRYEELNKMAVADYLIDLREYGEKMDCHDTSDLLERLKDRYVADCSKLKADAAKASAMLDNVFDFVEKAFGDGSEMAVIVADLTASKASAGFISTYGCDMYYKYNKQLMFYERSLKLKRAIDESL